MAMPASCIGLLTCVNGACSSISAAACGTTATKCLTALATAAGKANCMSAFFNYDDTMVVTPTSIINIPATCTTCCVTTCAPAFNTACVCTACNWLVPATPVTPAPAGNTHNIVICANTGAARCGTVCYNSYCGQCCTVTLCQLVGWTCINLCHLAGNSPATCASACGCLYPAISVSGDYYCVCICAILKVAACGTAWSCVCVTCAGTCKMCCCISAAGTCTCPSTSFCVICPNCVNYFLAACHQSGCGGANSSAAGCLVSVTCVSGKGYYCIGSTCTFDCAYST